LWKWLQIERTEYESIIKYIRSVTDDEIRKNLKSQLPAITPSGIFGIRQADMIEEYSGIICVDIDGKENKSIVDFEVLKRQLSQIPYIMYCGLSVSGKGLFCLIPIAYPQKHKQHFKALERDFKALGITVDKSCSDICRLRGYSYDKEAYINQNTCTYEACIETSLVIPSPKGNIPQKQYVPDKSSFIPETKTGGTPNNSDLLNYSIDNLKVLVTSKKDDIQNLIEKIEDQKIDITEENYDWFAIACILANIFGEEGRKLFHSVGQFYPRYTMEESNQKFSQCLQKRYNYSADRLFEIAKRYGVI